MDWDTSQSNVVREVDVNGNCFAVYGKVGVDYSTLAAQCVISREVTAGAERLFSDISVGWDYLDHAICAGDLVFVTATDETTGKSVKQQAACP